MLWRDRSCLVPKPAPYQRMKTSGMLVVAIVASALSVTPAAQAQTIFGEDFEVGAGDVSSLNDECGGNAQCAALKARGWDFVRGNCNGYCSMSIVPGASLRFANPRGGTVLRYEYRSEQDIEPVPQQDAHNSNLIKLFNPPLTELWGRVYFATDVNNAENATATNSLWFCCGTKLHYIKPGAAAPSYLLMGSYPSLPSGGDPHIGVQEMAVCPAGGTPIIKGGNGCNYAPQNAGHVTVVDKKWYCIEYHIKLNTAHDIADGELEVWIDNTQVVDYKNQLMADALPYTLHNARISQIEVYRQHANHMTRYEDDLVWSSTRVGCDNIVVDGVAPQAPANLQVQ